MISIIVCSINSKLLSEFTNSIKLTIGVPYEIISVDNLMLEYSIFKAYNYGVSLSKFDTFVFVHEDVIFHSKNWGEILLNSFETLSNPGVIGIAGSSYLPISPSDWWLSDSKYLYSNFLSNDKIENVEGGTLWQLGNQEPQPVFALDGMFLAMKKSVWLEFPFDESMEGFHGYDTSMCYRVSQKFQNYFVPDILIEHFSKGYPNQLWLRNTIQANQSVLPFIFKLRERGILDRKLEQKAYHLFLGQLLKYGETVNENISLAWKYRCLISKYVRTPYLQILFTLYLAKFIIQGFKNIRSSIV